MPDLSELRGNTSETFAEYNGQKIRIVFDADFYTPEIEESLSASDRPVSALASALSRCVVEWDITDNGKPVPIDERVLRSFGVGLLSAIAQAVFEASTPNAASSQS